MCKKRPRPSQNNICKKHNAKRLTKQHMQNRQSYRNFMHMQNARSAWMNCICKILGGAWKFYICNLREAPARTAYAKTINRIKVFTHAIYAKRLNESHMQYLYYYYICNFSTGTAYAIHIGGIHMQLPPMYPLCNTRNATTHAISVNEWHMQYLYTSDTCNTYTTTAYAQPMTE